MLVWYWWRYWSTFQGNNCQKHYLLLFTIFFFFSRSLSYTVTSSCWSFNCKECIISAIITYDIEVHYYQATSLLERVWQQPRIIFILCFGRQGMRSSHAVKHRIQKGTGKEMFMHEHLFNISFYKHENWKYRLLSVTWISHVTVGFWIFILPSFYVAMAFILRGFTSRFSHGCWLHIISILMNV